MTPEERFHLGLAAHRAGHLEMAERNYRRVLEERPSHVLARANLAQISLLRGEAAAAVALAREALAWEPRHPVALSNLAAALLETRAEPEAEAILGTLRDVAPEAVEWRINLGILRYRQHRMEEAERWFAEAAERAPGDAEARLDWASALERLGRYLEAEALLDDLLALVPEDPRPRWNKALLELRNGAFRQGWEDYETRWRVPTHPTRKPDYAVPEWDGKPKPEATLLLFAEQGYGDTLMFFRYLPWARARVGRLVLQVPRALASLAGRITAVDQVVSDGEPLPDFHAFAPLMSLARLHGTDEAHMLPAGGLFGSLAPEPGQPSPEAFLGPRDGRRRIGLVASGNAATDPARMPPLEAWAPLGEVEGVVWIGLHVPVPAAPGLPLAGLLETGPHLRSFLDTAQVLQHLDALVSVDTAVAHLGGILGKPVHLLLPHVADWRWQRNRKDSPWYPTLTLHRQRERGDWAQPMAEIRQALEREQR